MEISAIFRKYLREDFLLSNSCLDSGEIFSFESPLWVQDGLLLLCRDLMPGPLVQPVIWTGNFLKTSFYSLCCQGGG